MSIKKKLMRVSLGNWIFFKFSILDDDFHDCCCCIADVGMIARNFH